MKNCHFLGANLNIETSKISKLSKTGFCFTPLKKIYIVHFFSLLDVTPQLYRYVMNGKKANVASMRHREGFAPKKLSEQLMIYLFSQ